MLENRTFIFLVSNHAFHVVHCLKLRKCSLRPAVFQKGKNFNIQTYDFREINPLTTNVPYQLGTLVVSRLTCRTDKYEWFSALKSHGLWKSDDEIWAYLGSKLCHHKLCHHKLTLLTLWKMQNLGHHFTCPPDMKSISLSFFQNKLAAH